MKLLVLSFLIFSTSVIASVTIKERVHPTSMKFNYKTKLYTVSFLEKNAFYTSGTRHYKCLESALEKNKPVNVTFDIHEMKIVGCKKSQK